MAKKRVSGAQLRDLGATTVARALVKAEGGKLTDTAAITAAKSRLTKLQGGNEDEAIPTPDPKQPAS